MIRKISIRNFFVMVAVGIFISCMGSLSSFAAGDLAFEELKTRFDPEKPAVFKEVKVYLRVKNTSDEDMKGVIRGYDLTEGKKIEAEQSFTAIGGGRADVFMVFTPQKTGVHELSFRIIPWENYPNNDVGNDKIVSKIYVDADYDRDGIGDGQDSDDDNDGVLDKDDIFPKNAKESSDHDKDGIGDNADPDDDNDGIMDEDDAFPLDGGENGDSDGDGIGDNSDDDDDNDGLSDSMEKIMGTNPLKKDTDDDGVLDAEDDYPLDSKFQYDTDKDNSPNKIDKDDDNDGYVDEKDAFPLDKNEHADSDGDGIGDNGDEDDDNDGLLDTQEHEAGSDPKNPDTDGDGVMDGKDAFPLNPSETLDSDNDGVGDNADPNDENKGPVIVLPIENLEVERNQVFMLNAGDSYDPENGKLSYIWQLISEEGEVTVTREGEKFEVIFPFIGSQHIRLTVRDEADEPRVQEIFVKIFLSTREILLGIGIIILLNILGFLGYWIWKRRKK